MAVETTEAGTVITGEDVHEFAFRMGLRAIAMELSGSGMKMTRGFRATEFASRYGVKARTKKAALAGLVEMVREIDPDYEFPGGVIKALES